jgi:hypothetical protein
MVKTDRLRLVCWGGFGLVVIVFSSRYGKAASGSLYHRRLVLNLKKQTLVFSDTGNNSS